MLKLVLAPRGIMFHYCDIMAKFCNSCNSFQYKKEALDYFEACLLYLLIVKYILVQISVFLKLFFLVTESVSESASLYYNGTKSIVDQSRINIVCNFLFILIF